MNSATTTALVPGSAARALTRIVHRIGLLATTVAAVALLAELAVVLISIIGRTAVGHGIVDDHDVVGGRAQLRQSSS